MISKKKKKSKISKKVEENKEESTAPLFYIVPDDVGKKVKELIKKITKFSKETENFEKSLRGISLQGIITQNNYIEAQFQEINKNLIENKKNDPFLVSKQFVISLNEEVKSFDLFMQNTMKEVSQNNQYKLQTIKMLEKLEKDALDEFEMKKLKEATEHKINEFATKNEYKETQESLNELLHDIEKCKKISETLQKQQENNLNDFEEVTENDLIKLQQIKREIDKNIQTIEKNLNGYEEINNSIVILTQIQEQISFLKDEISILENNSQIGENLSIFSSKNGENSSMNNSVISTFSTVGGYSQCLDSLTQKFNEIHDSVYKFSRFFNGVKIITTKEIDDKIEKAKDVIQNIYQITTQCTQKANTIITNDVLEEKMTQLNQLISSIEQKIQNFSTQINPKTDLTVEIVNSKVEEYVKSSKEIQNISKRVDQLSEFHEQTSNYITFIKQQNQKQQDSINIYKDALKMQMNGNESNSLPNEQQINEIEDTITMINALINSSNNNYKKDLNEFKEQATERISAIEDRLNNTQSPQNVSDMINNSISAAKAKQFSQQEINFAKKQSDSISAYFDKKLTPKVNAFKKELIRKLNSEGNDASIMKEINSNRLKFIKQINQISEKSIKPNILVQTMDDFEIIRQNRENELHEAHNDFINEIPEQNAPITKTNVDKVTTKLKELPEIDKKLQFIGTKTVPLLSQMQKSISLMDNALKQKQNGNKNINLIEDPFLTKTKNKQQQKLPQFNFNEQQKKADSLLQYSKPNYEMSLEEIEKTLNQSKKVFDDFSKTFSKVNNLERIQTTINKKVENSKTSKKVTFSQSEKLLDSKSIPELSNKLNQIKLKIKELN